VCGSGRIWALDNRRHAVLLDRVVLAESMPVDCTAIVLKTVRDMHNHSVTPVGFECWSRNGVVDTESYSLKAVWRNGHVGDIEPVLNTVSESPA
jgi:hypothetical protein